MKSFALKASRGIEIDQHNNSKRNQQLSSLLGSTVQLQQGMKKQGIQQVANFSKTASESESSASQSTFSNNNDTIGGLENESNGDVQEEGIVPLFDTSNNDESSLPSPAASAYNSMMLSP